MKTYSDVTLPLLFPDLRVYGKRFAYLKPYVKWVRSYVFAGKSFDLPLSDLEYKFAHPEAALEQGRISELEYKKIKKYLFT